MRYANPQKQTPPRHQSTRGFAIPVGGGSEYVHVSETSDGFFVLPLPPGTWDLYADNTFPYGGYLYALRSGQWVADGQTLQVPDVSILGGDVGRDGQPAPHLDNGVVDIYDISFIVTYYPSQPACPGSVACYADITGDGFVDIYDVTVAANNFLKREPTPW